jgi:uncharacterized protein (TIGR03067 family)
MKSKFCLLCVTMGALSLVSAAGETETTPSKSDLDRLQGRWNARAGARREVRVMLEIKGRQATASIKTPTGVRLLLEGEVKLDETTTPRRLDWIKFTGADQQEFPPLLAIYIIEGDRFTVCNGGLNGSRPTEFKRGDGILAEVVTFQREPTVAANKSKRSAKPRATAER